MSVYVFTGEMPDRIWADPPETFDGMDVWRSEPGGKGIPFLRATPAREAADDLLAVMEDAERSMEEFCRDQHPDNVCCHTLRAMRAAIAKAMGEAK